MMQPFCIRHHVNTHQDGHKKKIVNTWIALVTISDRKWILITNFATTEIFWSLSFGD
jgi:hypothetical protein